jgi:hypothetical protein
MYDDEFRWTICPHHSLDWGVKGPPVASPYLPPKPEEAEQEFLSDEVAQGYHPVTGELVGKPYRISLCWYWRNFWVGVRYSGNRHAIYINMIPCLSLRIELRKKP